MRVGAGFLGLRLLLLPALLLGVVAMHQLPLAGGPPDRSRSVVAEASNGFRAAAPAPLGHEVLAGSPDHGDSDHGGPGCCGEKRHGGHLLLHMCLAVFVAVAVCALPRRRRPHAFAPPPLRTALRTSAMPLSVRPSPTPNVYVLRVLRL